MVTLNTGSETSHLGDLALPEGLFKMFPSWERLESRNRADEFGEGLQARAADALWMITRQWQIGELQAELAGSLCNVCIEYETEAVSGYSLGKAGSFTGLPPQDPLEVLVEREATPWNWRMRIRTGQQFERILRDPDPSFPAGYDVEGAIEELREQFPVKLGDSDSEMDEASRRLVKMLAGKAINGEELWDNLDGLDKVPEGAKAKLKQWYGELFARPDSNNGSAWQSRSLDYHFRTRTERDTELASEHYRNGDLEWYSANHVREGTEPAGGEDRTQVETNLLPGRVSFGGMPHPRWWLMEDRNINLGALDTSKSELIKPMFMNFALIHGDDWFVVPLSLDIGSLTTVKCVVTTDVFGEKMEILNGRVNDQDPLKRWDLFSLAKNAGPRLNAERDYLYIPPSSGFREESEPLEEVNFIRDEEANLAFAIEEKMLNGWGKPVSVIEYHRERERLAELPGSPETTAGANANGPNSKPQLQFKLATPVDKNWIPYAPEKIDEPGNQTQIFLERAALPDVGETLENGPFVPPEPVSRVLNESSKLNEEVILRSGLSVTLNAQRLRWTDGKTYVWLGRKVLPANRQRSSDLEFDVISFENGVANGS